MKDFYLTLLSDSSLNMFPDNKQSEFTVRLDHPIHIEDERWEVALVEIATPSEVLSITEQNNFFFLTFLDQWILQRCVAMILLRINVSYSNWQVYVTRVFSWRNVVLYRQLWEGCSETSKCSHQRYLWCCESAHENISSKRKTSQALISKAIRSKS